MSHDESVKTSGQANNYLETARRNLLVGLLALYCQFISYSSREIKRIDNQYKMATLKEVYPADNYEIDVVDLNNNVIEIVSQLKEDLGSDRLTMQELIDHSDESWWIVTDYEEIIKTLRNYKSRFERKEKELRKAEVKSGLITRVLWIFGTLIVTIILYLSRNFLLPIFENLFELR